MASAASPILMLRGVMHSGARYGVASATRVRPTRSRVAAAGQQAGSGDQFLEPNRQRGRGPTPIPFEIHEDERVVRAVRQGHPPVPPLGTRFDSRLLGKPTSLPIGKEGQGADARRRRARGRADRPAARVGQESGAKVDAAAARGRVDAESPAALLEVSLPDDRRLQHPHSDRPGPLQKQLIEVSPIHEQSLLRGVLPFCRSLVPLDLHVSHASETRRLHRLANADRLQQGQHPRAQRLAQVAAGKRSALDQADAVAQLGQPEARVLPAGPPPMMQMSASCAKPIQALRPDPS